MRNPEPEIAIYHLARRFGWTPEEIDRQDPSLIEKIVLIDGVVVSKEQQELKRATDRTR